MTREHLVELNFAAIFGTEDALRDALRAWLSNSSMNNDGPFLEHLLYTITSRGSIACMQILLEHPMFANHQANAQESLVLSAHTGLVEMVRMLLPFSTPSYSNSAALRRAAAKGHLDCVRLLIPVSNPKDCDSAALRVAALGDHYACVDVLFDVSDPPRALEVIQRDFISLPSCSRAVFSGWDYLERRCALMQKDKILHACETSSSRRKHKI